MGKETNKQRLNIGILAHVDAGKTTLSEAMLFETGAVRKMGRVDHRDAFLDTHSLERERGITIFSKQAVFPLGEQEVTLLDTPGHVDFSSETERTLQVLDCAILVISGSDGVQGHTLTLWRLLKRYRVPTFLFVNKMDLAGADRGAICEQLASRLSAECLDVESEGFFEQAAMGSEDAMEEFLETESLSKETLRGLIAQRRLFPVWFGSALKNEGVSEFLQGLETFAPRWEWPAAFGARVYKITRDGQGARLTWLKVTGGVLKVKAMLGDEKVDQIRLYSGGKFTLLDEAPAGTVCAVTGPVRTRAGQSIGAAQPPAAPVLEPVLSYQLILPEGCNVHEALTKLRMLEEEEPQLHLVWNEALQELHVQLMGQIQLEVLQRIARERFGLEVGFGEGGILYQETLAEPVEGIGHFEPLRHYAEVHLLLEPGERGSGLQFRTDCPEDKLARHWQRLIMTHLQEKPHLGVLTGSPITDLIITLTAGRAHAKHTEGGDFRQATYRAVRQGLMMGESVLLEPWYEFRLELPGDQVGRAMTDLQRMGGEVRPPETTGEEVVLTGFAPVSGLRNYTPEVLSYTRGRGRLSCLPGGYRPCVDPEPVIDAFDYDPVADLDNSPDSVFCSHGAGVLVPWDEVPERAHLESGRFEAEEEVATAPVRRVSSSIHASDDELQAIYERTYGAVKRRDVMRPAPRSAVELPDKQKVVLKTQDPGYLLVDGYNVIFAWDELERAARQNLDAARQLLMDLLSNYQGVKGCTVILVFDAYKVKNNPGEVSKYHNIYTVYTKEAETADTYIERTTYELGKHHHVRVVTSDGAEQLIILGHGALRVSARIFHQEVEEALGEISRCLSDGKSQGTRSVKAAFEKANYQD